MNFVSPHRQTPVILSAIEQMRAVVAAHGTDTATRVYATALHEHLRTEWATSRGMKRSTGHPCIWRLIGKRCTRANCGIPGDDHPSLWVRNGNAAAYISQPYHLTTESMAALVAFCNKHALTVTARTWPGWHFPGAVLTLVITRKDAPEYGAFGA